MLTVNNNVIFNRLGRFVKSMCMKTILYFLAGAALLFSCTEKRRTKAIEIVPEELSWKNADSIKSHLQQAAIPSDTFLISDLGLQDNPQKIQAAINLVASHGGGTILLSNGLYNSGPIDMKSNVELHLQEHAILKFIPDTNLYALKYVWFSGIPCMNYAPMIYAKDANNIKISGKGTVDGFGNHPVWKNMKYKEHIEWDLLVQQASDNIPIKSRKYGIGHSLRPDLIAFYNCSKINISGVKIVNSPYWAVHPVMSNHITIQNCDISSRGYEQVGLAIESSQNILVDNINIKGNGEGLKFLSGRTEIPDNQPTAYVIVQDCSFSNINHSPITFSSTSFAGLNNIYLSDIEINNVGTAVCFYGKKGVKINNIFIKDVVAQNISSSFLYIRMLSAMKSTPILTGIYIKDCEVNNCARAFVIHGEPYNSIQHIKISDSRFVVSKVSFVKHTQKFEISNVELNDTTISVTKRVGHNAIPEIYLKSPEDEILNTVDVEYKKLPYAIKKVLNERYAFVPIKEIHRVKTSSKVIYKMNMEIEPYDEIEIVVEENGKLLSSKSKIAYSNLPEPVVQTIERHLKTNPSPFIFNNINRINYKDFTYYELIGEYDSKLFALGVSADGKIIEEKQQSLSGYFLDN